MRGVGDLGGFVLGAMIAPEVIVVEGRHVGVDGNDGGAGGVDGDGQDLVPDDAGLGYERSRVAEARARMWSSCDCVACSGSSRLRLSG